VVEDDADESRLVGRRIGWSTSMPIRERERVAAEQFVGGDVLGER
jgi:hypothetical protein